MCPKGILPSLLVYLPRNGLLNILSFCYFCCTCDHSKHHNLDIFIVSKNGLHHFKAQRISFHLVYLAAKFEDVDS